MNRIALTLLFLLALPLAAQAPRINRVQNGAIQIETATGLVAAPPPVIQAFPYNAEVCPSSPAWTLVADGRTDFGISIGFGTGQPGSDLTIVIHGKAQGGGFAVRPDDDQRIAIAKIMCFGLVKDICGQPQPPIPQPQPQPVPTPQPSSYPNYGVWSFLAQPSSGGLKALGAQVGDVIWTAQKNPPLSALWWTVTRPNDTPANTPDGLIPKQTGVVQ